jgi:hypothetical protein
MISDPPLSARLIAGPSGLPMAWDEFITINYVGEPGEPEWDPASLVVDVTASTPRGPSGFVRWELSDGPISTALVAPTERVTYTVHIENRDFFPTPVLYADVWPLPQDYLETWNPGIHAFNGLPVVDGADYGLILGTPTTWDYNGGIGWLGSLSQGEDVEFSYWVEMPVGMPLGGDHTSGVDVYDAETYDWYGWDMAGAYYRPFRTSGSYKTSGMGNVLPGWDYHYTIALVNAGAQDRDVIVRDVLPAQVDYLWRSGGDYDPGTRTFTWATTMVGNGEYQSVQIGVRAHADLAYRTPIVNQARVRRASDDALLATLTDVTEVGTGADLTLDKDASKLVAGFNETIRYTITLHNAGTQTAKNVIMRDEDTRYLDVMPASIWTPGIWSTCDWFVDGAVQWCGDIGAGETVTLRYDARVNTFAHKGLALINAATAEGDNLPEVLYDSAVTEILHMSKNWLPIIFIDARVGADPI